MVILQEQLWRKDWYDYKYERYRVQITAFALRLHFLSSGRIFESSAYTGSGRGLCYKVSQSLGREFQEITPCTILTSYIGHDLYDPSKEG